MKRTVNKFSGMAPRFGDELRPGFGTIAENVDLSAGKLSPLPAHAAVGSGSSGADSLVYHQGAFECGSGRFYFEHVVNDHEILFYLDEGVLKKRINGSVANVGQEIPGAPTVENLTDSYEIFSGIMSDATSTSSSLLSLWGWHASAEYPGEYYTTAAMLPGMSPFWYFSRGEPDQVVMDSSILDQGAVGSLTEGQWGWGAGAADVGTTETLYFKPFDNYYMASLSCQYNPGELTGTYNYAITLTRDVGGYTDESGIGSPTDDTELKYSKSEITRPGVSDADVTHWNLYRISLATGVYQFVATVPIDTTVYLDNTSDADLDDGTCPTYFESDQGNEINCIGPTAEFDGLAGMHSGMLFAWSGHSLYWNEPGNLDGWPAYYYMNFPSEIMGVVCMAGAVAVLTRKAPYRVDGTHPELLTPSKALGMEPCLGGCTETSQGVAYYSDSGIVLFNLYETSVVSDVQFTEEWFTENINAGSVFMSENDSKLFVFHDAGVLVLDASSGRSVWFTLDLVSTAAFKRSDNGQLYALSGTDILEISGSSEKLSWTFRSGFFGVADTDDTEFQSVEVFGSGDLYLKIFVDGDLKAEKAIDPGVIRNRRLGLKQEDAGRGLQFELSGTGRVTEVVVR